MSINMHRNPCTGIGNMGGGGARLERGASKSEIITCAHKHTQEVLQK